MGQRWSFPEFILLAFFGLLLLFLADATARYLSSYYLGTTYPLGTVLRPMVFGGAVALAVLLAVKAREETTGRVLTSRAAEAVALGAAAAGILFLDLRTLALMGIALPYAVTDALWFTLYGLALVALPLFLARRIRRTYGWTPALVLVLIAVGFFLALLQPIYFWVQNIADVALPYGVVLVGMFGPLVALSGSGFAALAVEIRRRPVGVPSAGLWGLLAIPAVLFVPPAIQSLATPLPNLILRGWTFWTLGFVGYGWYTSSLLAAAFAVYLFLLARNRSREPAQRLLSLAILTFPLSGIFVLFLDYSAIPGILVSLLAAGLALDHLAAGRDAT